MMSTARYMLVILALLSFSKGYSQLAFDIEGNYVLSTPYNTVRIPANGGTEIDLPDDLDQKETFTYRLRVNYTINKRHILSVLAAPLKIKYTGSFDEDVVYDNATFAAAKPIEATYKFNSYRFTYRYMIVRKPNISVGVGITGKIRDANITLASGDVVADFPNVGFVPLINFYVEWYPLTDFGILLEGDALATGQGRAEDIFLGATYRINRSTALKAGYRVLEGGADVEDNYNFSFINYLSAGLMISLGN